MVRWIDGCSCVATYHIYKHIVVGFFLFTCNALCGSLPWCKIFRCVPGSSESHFAAKSAAILPKPGSATHTSPLDMTTVRFLPQSPIQIRFSSGNKPWIFRVFRSFFFLKIMYHVASPFFWIQCPASVPCRKSRNCRSCGPMSTSPRTCWARHRHEKWG